ncbi:hypothetical protein LINPERHAP2_LOCUS9998 [Linum perenne]
MKGRGKSRQTAITYSFFVPFLVSLSNPGSETKQVSRLSPEPSSEVVVPILLNELLHRLTTHHNYTTSGSNEARKDLEKLMSSILEIAVACSSDIPQERTSMSEVLSSLTAIKTSLVGRR